MRGKRIETEEFTTWTEDDGVLRLSFVPGTRVTLDVAERIVEFGFESLHGHPGPVLVRLDGVSGISREVRNFAMGVVDMTAAGLVVRSPITRAVGGMFVGLLHGVPYPVRLFGTEEEALDWLKTHRLNPPEDSELGGEASISGAEVGDRQ